REPREEALAHLDPALGEDAHRLARALDPAQRDPGIAVEDGEREHEDGEPDAPLRNDLQEEDALESDLLEPPPVGDALCAATGEQERDEEGEADEQHPALRLGGRRARHTRGDERRGSTAPTGAAPPYYGPADRAALRHDRQRFVHHLAVE